MAQRDWVSVFVGLGANLGQAQNAVEDAVVALGKLSNTRLLACSALYRSTPVDASGPDYVNAVAHLESRINAYELLRAFQDLENRAGRERPYFHAPRTLDIDMLLFGGSKIQSQELTVPHPRMMERAFVLLPLSDLAPDLVPSTALQQVKNQAIEKLSTPGSQ